MSQFASPQSVNVWVCLRCAFGWLSDGSFSHAELDRFTLEQMARFLIRAVESHYGVVKEFVISNRSSFVR
ncbi:MAG TPA: hypothetical protein VFD70_11420 [Anaerolineae bacterium]|nr:hypothetical protein [Anaerolineae bacterium]